MDKVCRICLKKGSQHEEVDNILKDLLDALLISLDTNGSQKSIICKECVARIYELFDFKTLCLYTEDALLPFIEKISSKMSQLDLRSVYSKNELRQFLKSNEKADICRLCLEITTQWVSLETAILQTSIRDVFENNLPEISSQSIKRPSICEKCLKMLNNLYNFAVQCKRNADVMQIEMNEKLVDGIENGVERSIQRRKNSDTSSKTKESDLKSIISQNKLKTHRPLEKSMKPNSCHVQCDSYGDLSDEHRTETLTRNETKKSCAGIKRHPCAVCGQTFDTEPIMMEHIKRVHGRNICRHCGKKFSLFNNLNRHLRTHMREIPYTCAHCEKGFYRKDALTSHLLSHARKKRYSCPHCESKFSRKKSLQKHMRDHAVVECAHRNRYVKIRQNSDPSSKTEESAPQNTLEDSIKPNSCHVQCNSDGDVNEEHSAETLTSNETHYCAICDQAFDAVPTMMEHIENVHGRNICSHCGKKFSTKQSLNRHHTRTHMRETPYICAHCGKEFYRKDALSSHLLTHATKKLFSCPQCEREFFSKASLQRHVRDHAVVEPFICGHCGNKFLHKRTLITHILIHRRNNSYICSFCGKAFSQKGNLENHQRTHAVDKAYKCAQCGNGFFSKGSLKRHFLVHAEEKPHICSVCGKGFTEKSSLKTHLRSHSGEKPHVCEQCGKRFSAKSTLNMHIFTHTGEKPHICSICGKRFSRKVNLNMHLRRHTRKKSHVFKQMGKKIPPCVSSEQSPTHPYEREAS